jgi:hypothetical protein
MVDLVAELFAAIDALEGAQVEAALCGGLALTVHGHVRATKDIDFLLPREAFDRALEVLARCGYDVPALPMTFGAGTTVERYIQRVSKLNEQGVVTIDLIAVQPAFVEVWASRQRFERDGRRLCVVSREGLIAMKRLAGRAQDVADIEALERQEREL